MNTKEIEAVIKNDCERINNEYQGQVLDKLTIEHIVALIVNDTVRAMIK